MTEEDIKETSAEELVFTMQNWCNTLHFANNPLYEEKKKDGAPEGCVWVGPKLEKEENVQLQVKDEQFGNFE